MAQKPHDRIMVTGSRKTRLPCPGEARCLSGVYDMLPMDWGGWDEVCFFGFGFCFFWFFFSVFALYEVRGGPIGSWFLSLGRGLAFARLFSDPFRQVNERELLLRREMASLASMPPSAGSLERIVGNAVVDFNASIVMLTGKRIVIQMQSRDRKCRGCSSGHWQRLARAIKLLRFCASVRAWVLVDFPIARCKGENAWALD